MHSSPADWKKVWVGCTNKGRYLFIIDKKDQKTTIYWEMGAFFVLGDSGSNLVVI
jgi:hypothetical protein